MTMGEKILALRKARGWSQEELADQIGVTRQAVGRWESDSAKPDVDRIIDLCDLFGVSADYLLRDLSGGAVTEPVVQREEMALSRAIRELPFRRWVGGVLTMICGTGLVVFRVLSAMHPCIYDEYIGLPAFLKTFGLEGLWLVLAIGLGTGLWKMLSPRPLGEYPFRDWGQMLLKQAKAVGGWLINLPPKIWKGICTLNTR